MGNRDKSSAKNEKKTKAKKSTNKVPKTVQQSIPYESVFPNGIIMSQGGKYSKTYRLEDANFSTADQSTQENMYLDYEGLLNSVDAGMTAQITVFNRSESQGRTQNKFLMKPQNDGLNKYRDDMNQMISDKLTEGRNNLTKEKYFTISVQAPNVKDADTIFRRLDSEVNSKVGRINKKDTPPMTLEERLSVFYDIYNANPEFPFSKKIAPIMKNDKLDLKALNGSGLSSKDLIGPDSMYFAHNYFMVGERYGRALFLDNLPTFMNANVLTDITDLACNMITSVIYTPIPTEKAATMVKHQLTNINENIVRAQKNAARGNYSSDIIPSELKRAKEEAEDLRNDMQSRNQKLFKVSVVMVLFADSKDELDQLTASLESIGVTHLSQVKTLLYQQEAGLHTALPLADMDITIDRVLNTEASAVFMPFSVQELSQENGIYYGQNAISRNLIKYDRLSSDNYNGLIFGKPGSGKSFIAKSEMLSVILTRPDSVVFVIDPEGEYRPTVEAFGGQVIRLAVGSNTNINPLDMDVQYAGEAEDPIAMKCDFLTAMCETIVGHGQLTPVQVNLIHRCGRRIYRPYYEHMRKVVNQKDQNGHRITCDRQAMPTLVDFYQELIHQSDPSAQALAASLEMYCIGNYDLFAKQTNVDTNSRFVVYDIKDVPSGAKELALQICLNDVWNRIIENKKKNILTWFYVDEFYLLLQTRSSAQFLQQIYKRARKWGGIPTGITQNVEDLLTNEDARTILNNCNFLLMMNQSQIDRAALSELYSISDSLQEYITDKPAGTGLMYTGDTIIPFQNSFPKDNELYKIMSTKATEKNDLNEDAKIVLNI